MKKLITAVVSKILCIFINALFIKILWNCIMIDFGMPKITFWKSVGLIYLIGFLFTNVLSVIEIYIKKGKVNE